MPDDGTRSDAPRRKGASAIRCRTGSRLNVLSWEVGRHRQSLPLMVRRTMSFSAAPRFDEHLVSAVREFYGLSMDVTTAEAEILEDEDERIRFFPWFLWDWRPDADTPTIGEQFLDKGERPHHERRLLEALCASYVGFYEALEDAGTSGVAVRDMVTGETLQVDDDGLAGELFAGQILQARLVRIPTSGPTCVLVDAVYAVIPEEGRAGVEMEIESLPVSAGGVASVMEAFACEMLEAAEQILESLARPPVTTNADGERMVLARCAWRGPTAADASEVVATDADVFRATGDGLWQWRIEDEPRGWVQRPAPGRLLLGATSPERLDELLRDLAERADVTPPPVRSLTDFPSAAEGWVRSGGGDVWLDLPEVREAARAWLTAWPRDWVDTPWPELGDRTPRDAVNLSDGRRAVEQLLARIERMQGDASGPVPVDRVRRDLGLR
ncbi:MAG: hypothetical protein ACQEXJ_14730 [Myxococcota bacterium]